MRASANRPTGAVDGHLLRRISSSQQPLRHRRRARHCRVFTYMMNLARLGMQGQSWGLQRFVEADETADVASAPIKCTVSRVRRSRLRGANGFSIEARCL